METKAPALIANDRTRTTVSHLDFIWIPFPHNSPSGDIRVRVCQEGQDRKPSMNQEGPPVNRSVAQAETARSRIGPGHYRDRRQPGFHWPAGLKRSQGSAISEKPIEDLV